MTKLPNKTFVRKDIWREGEWLDLWSVVHFMSGMLVGFGFYFFHFDALHALAIALLCFILYEMWEALMHMEETPANRFMDVVVGMASFSLVFFLLAPRLSSALFLPTFGAVFVVDIILSFFGWRESQKAALLEKRVRARYALARENLHRKSQRFLRKNRYAGRSGLKEAESGEEDPGSGVS